MKNDPKGNKGLAIGLAIWLALIAWHVINTVGDKAVFNQIAREIQE